MDQGRGLCLLSGSTNIKPGSDEITHILAKIPLTDANSCLVALIARHGRRAGFGTREFRGGDGFHGQFNLLCLLRLFLRRLGRRLRLSLSHSCCSLILAGTATSSPTAPCRKLTTHRAFNKSCVGIRIAGGVYAVWFFS